MKLLTLKLFFILSICAHCISIRSSKRKIFLQTRMKLTTLSQYLTMKPKINVDINQIKGKSKLFAYFSSNQTSIQISSSPPMNEGQTLISEGEYLKSRFQTGWDKFNSHTYSSANPIIQCYTIGIIEGLLSSDEIYDYRKNYEYFFDNPNDIDKIKAFLTKVNNNIQEKLSLQTEDNLNEKDIQIISYLACLHAQINGLHLGYSMIASGEKKLELSDLYFLNTEGYYSYILAYLKLNDVNITNKKDFKSDENLFKYYNTNKIEEIWKKLIKKAHCSAIIKLITEKNGKTNVIVGHNTMTGYNELLRTLKHVKYEFEGSNPVIGMNPFEMKYSSYPGILFSGDEFYKKDKLIITQTSLSVINQFEFKNSIRNQDEYIPEFMRIMIINFLSNNGKEWVDNYQSLFQNNHVYCAQWIIIDYANIDKDSGLLYIVEELPKSVKSIDYTTELKDKSYYGSFNLPFFRKDHSEIAGFDMFSNVDFFSKNYNPRDYILEQLEGDIKTREDFKNVLMYNGYKRKTKIKEDPSFNNPSNGIASRTIKGHDGTIDFKIVDNDLVNEDQIYVYSGPVYETNPNFKVYDLNKESRNIRQYSKGMPKVWNFKPFIYY